MGSFFSLRLRRITTHLTSPVGGGEHRTSIREGVVLELSDREGLVGIGEASPLPGYSPDSLDDCVSQLAKLAEKHFALPELDQKEPIGQWLERISSQLTPTVPAARHALETAVLHWYSQKLAVPAWTLLASGLTPGQFASHSRHVEHMGLRLSGLVDFNLGPAESERRLEQAVRNGFREFKIKLGPKNNWERDLSFLRKLHAQWGHQVTFRLDINQAWTVQEAEEKLSRLTEFSLDWIEEPVRADQIDLLTDSPVPLALDESLQNREEWNANIDWLRRCQVAAIVLKPMALGGVSRCLRYAVQAQALGIKIIVTHLFDGPVAWAAAISLAMAVGSRQKAHGLAPHPVLEMDPEYTISGVRGAGWYAPSSSGMPILFRSA